MDTTWINGPTLAVITLCLNDDGYGDEHNSVGLMKICKIFPMKYNFLWWSSINRNQWRLMELLCKVVLWTQVQLLDHILLKSTSFMRSALSLESCCLPNAIRLVGAWTLVFSYDKATYTNWNNFVGTSFGKSRQMLPHGRDILISFH